jgi:hypothetical protein
MCGLRRVQPLPEGKGLGREVDHTPESAAEIKNARSSASFVLRLHGVLRNYAQGQIAFYFPEQH